MNVKVTKTMNEEIILGGGCFWCLDAVYREIRGVIKVVSGYAGGAIADPTYKEVCTGLTGHAEAVQITFDPRMITLEKILRIFFFIHDPTTLNFQGNDTGTQYRSIIFYRNQKQKDVIDKVIGELIKDKIYDNPIVTEVVPVQSFYAAEDYHQNYYEKNKQEGYCRIIINPKMEKLRKDFLDSLKN